MKNLVTVVGKIYREDRGVLVMMILVFLVGMGLVLLPVIDLAPSNPKTWVRYVDVGQDMGYEEGDWWYILGFAVLGLVIGVLHNLIAVRLYQKRGRDMAMLFLGVSVGIAVLAILYLLKILGEG
jgi:hypothetical protein